MKNISEILENVKTVGIGGHIRPDGDCIGSCMALYLYIRKYFPDIEADVYLEDRKPVFDYIDRMDEVKTEAEEDKVYDLFITCDVSALDRLAVARKYFDAAKKTACIDHHVSNNGFADVNHVRGEISSASEVLYGLLDSDKIDRSIAVPIYTGMAHDTGVFQYSSTTPETMRIAGELMKTGFDFSRIIDESFYQKTYLQNQVMGRVLAESILLQGGKCVVGYLKKREMDFYSVEGKDLEGIVSQLRLTAGVEVAIFIYEMQTQFFKVSLRSNGKVDVSKIAVFFGGGILVIRKEKGYTSHDVVAKLRGILHMKKIGHTGTLDPAAEGVLPVALGKGTRLVELLTEKEKTYEAVLRLGVSTDTQDMTGVVLSEKTVTVTEEEVREAVGSFVGEQQQVPPMYSALKVNGKKLYELAREGKTIERKPRPVVFYEIRILDMELPLVRISVTCSKGTYIRTLCNDIGEKLGCGGAMEELLRTRSGNFTLEESMTLSQVEEAVADGTIGEKLVSIEDVLSMYPVLTCTPEGDRLLNNGNPLPEELVQGGSREEKVRMYKSSGNFTGIYGWDERKQKYVPIRMFFV